MMKIPLFFFSIHLVVLMGVAALTATINRDGNIVTTTLAQPSGVQNAGSE